jgi:predicted ferric reductase
MTPRRQTVHAVLLIGLYLAIVLAPLALMLAGPRPEGRPYLRDLSVALAFSGMSLIGLQFALTARIPLLKRPFGSDVVYFFHHHISIVGFGLIVLHIVLLLWIDPTTWRLFHPLEAPLRARFAVAGLVCFVALIFLSLARRKIRLEYTAWRISHGVLAIGAVIFGMVHMQLVGYYLSSPWKRGLWAGYAALWIAALAYARVVRPFLLKRRPYRVDQIREERGGAWTVRLSPVGHDGARFHPGQFAWLTIGRSPFADVEHPFSYSSSAEHPACPTFTIKALGDFTATIPRVPIGTPVYVDGPFGAFTLDRHPSAEGFVFVAGGIGITPLMSMLRTLRDRSDMRPCLLIYAVRSMDQATFAEELEELRRTLALEIVWVPAEPPANWDGPSGFLNGPLIDQLLPSERRTGNVQAFVCGPPVMMDLVEDALVKIGIPLRAVHTERFNLA